MTRCVDTTVGAGAREQGEPLKEDVTGRDSRTLMDWIIVGASEKRLTLRNKPSRLQSRRRGCGWQRALQVASVEERPMHVIP